MQTCIDCKQNKDIKNFPMYKNGKYKKRCSDCFRLLYKQNYAKKPEYFKKRAAEDREKKKNMILNDQLDRPNIDSKKCTKCHITKDVSEFTFRKTRNIYDGPCKECNKIREKNRRDKHKDKINERRREITKPRTQKQQMILNLRKRLNALVKNRPIRNYCLKLLGCSYDTFRQWVNYNFDKDPQWKMNWDNYGDVWQIDHVKPCESFDLSIKEEIEICFNWRNLRPVCRSYNAAKQNKIIQSDIDLIKNRAEEFIKLSDH